MEQWIHHTFINTINHLNMCTMHLHIKYTCMYCYILYKFWPPSKVKLYEMCSRYTTAVDSVVMEKSSLATRDYI